MAGADNLIGKGFADRSTEEARELGRRGGVASGIARREKRNLRMQLEMLLDKEYKVKVGDGEKLISGGEAVSTKLLEKALKGDVRAFEVLRDTIGQRPVEKIMVAEVDTDIIDEVENAVLGNDKTTGD